MQVRDVHGTINTVSVTHYLVTTTGRWPYVHPPRVPVATANCLVHYCAGAGMFITERLPRRAVVHAVPGALVLISALWLMHSRTMPTSLADAIRYVPYGVFGAGLLLSALFHRSRIFHALLVLFASNIALAVAAGRIASPNGEVLVRLVALLLPINIVLISFLPETGIFSRSGFVRLLVFAFEGVVVAVASRFYAARSLALISDPFTSRIPVTSFRGLPQSVLLAFAIACLLLVFQLIRRRFRPTDVGFYWALFSSFIALCVLPLVQPMSLGFAAGAIVLVIALLEAFYAMAYYDELTDLPGRRSFNDAKLRLGNTYTVAMVDVDHFKRFNDTYGHDAGDQVLRMVASRIAQVSGGGKGYRYGGEEFAVLFPGKRADETFPHLERLRRSIEELPFKLRSHDRRKQGKKQTSGRSRGAKRQTNVTVSIGASAADRTSRKPDDFVKAADRALYRAKSLGRNCTVVTETELQ